MKRLLITALLLAAPTYSLAQLSPLDQRSERVQKVDASGRVYLQNGSVINGRIVEADGKVSVTTYEGNLFIYDRNEVLRIEYGKSYQPKSGALAVVLSLIFPGAGNYYVGDNIKGTIFAGLGIAGVAALLHGQSLKNKEDQAYLNSGQHPAYDADAWIKYSSAAIVGTMAISIMTAYEGSLPPKIDNTKVSLLSFEF